MTTLTEQLKSAVVELDAPERVVASTTLIEVEDVDLQKRALFGELTPQQLVMTGLISQGSTLNQAATRLHMTRKQAHRQKEHIQALFALPNMASVVHLAVSSEVMRVESDKSFDNLGSISDFDAMTLELYGRGVSNDELARAIYKDPSWLMKYEKELFEKLGAWTRPHAIRRGHEIGLLAVGGSR